MTAEHESRRWVDRRRVSCELPDELVARMQRQADMMGIPRNDLIEAACTGLVRELERIDADAAAGQR